MAKHHSILSGILGAVAIMFMVSAPAHAFLAECTDAAGLPCIVNGDNDWESSVEDALYDVYGYAIDVMRIDKAEANSWTGSNGLTVSFDSNSGGTSGTWTYTGPEDIAFITIKAGNRYALYSASDLIDNVTSNYVTGHWTTYMLTNKFGCPQALSHLSIWKVVDNHQVPEPLPLGLILLGLVLVAWQYSRRAAGARNEHRAVVA